MNREEPHRQHEDMVTALLDVRKLVQRCVEMERELWILKQQHSEQEQQLSRLRTQEDHQQGLIKLGEQELQRWKNEIRTCLRAIAHHTGDDTRLHSLGSLLHRDDLSPEDVRLWHQKLMDEFRMLYPTQPVSKATSDSELGISGTMDWSAYRLAKQ